MGWKRCFVAMTLTALLLFPAGQSLAEEKDDEATADRWSGDASIGFSMTSGNADTSSLGLDLKAVRDTKSGRVLTLLGTYLLDTAEGETTNNKGKSEAKYDISLNERFLYFSELIVSFDQFKDIDLRVVPGAGVSYLTLLGQRYRFSTLAGVSYVLEYFTDGSEDKRATFRLGNSFDLNLSPHSSIEQRFDIFSGLDDPGDYIFRVQVSLKTAINRSWSIKITAIDDFDSKPLEAGIKKNDISLLTSISYSF